MGPSTRSKTGARKRTNNTGQGRQQESDTVEADRPQNGIGERCVRIVLNNSCFYYLQLMCRMDESARPSPVRNEATALPLSHGNLPVTQTSRAQTIPHRISLESTRCTSTNPTTAAALHKPHSKHPDGCASASSPSSLIDFNPITQSNGRTRQTSTKASFLSPPFITACRN